MKKNYIEIEIPPGYDHFEPEITTKRGKLDRIIIKLKRKRNDLKQNKNLSAYSESCAQYLIYQDEFVELYNCDSKLFENDKRTVDLVFADPPFGMNLDEFEFLLFDFKNRIKGHTFLMSNERHLAKIIVKHEDYFRRLFCVDTVVPKMINSSMPMTQADFIAEFRMLGAENNKFINLKDGFTTLIRANKNRHLKNYSQNFDKGMRIFYEIFKHYTKEGDLILDHFCGSGNSLIAARQLKRRIIGFEIDEKSANYAKDKLLQHELF